MSEVIQLNGVAVGKPSLLGRNRQGEVYSGIRKRFVETDRVEVGFTNILGDGQADLTVHGGVDKAIYCYPTEHTPYWKQELAYRDDDGFTPFGENLPTAGVTEADVCIGDIWRWGDAVVQVAQPRWPCLKLALHSGHIDMIRRFVASGRSGWYLRVLEEGTAPVSGQIEVIARDPERISVEFAFAVKTNGDAEGLSRVIAHPLLADGWK